MIYSERFDSFKWSLIVSLFQKACFCIKEMKETRSSLPLLLLLLKEVRNGKEERKNLSRQLNELFSTNLSCVKLRLNEARGPDLVCIDTAS